jgi:phage anti-repressor protein
MIKINFKEFLKKYSNLNNEFIDDFYNIYDFNETNNNDFIINLEIIIKWLNMKKMDLKKTLIRTYIKNIDYIINKNNNKNIGSGGHNKENILLTPDCFKRLCMLSKTKKAEEVRTYFLELEKLIHNYKNYIIEALQSTVNLLENNSKEVSQKIKGTVYILRSPKDIDGIYRFGQTESFKKRLSNYNSANSDKMEVLYIFETKDSKKIQDCVIVQIKELRYRKRKDFYEINLNLLKKIINECSEFTLKYKKSIIKQKKNQDGGNVQLAHQNLFLYIKNN